MTVVPSGVEESPAISETSRDVSNSVDMTKRLFASLSVFHDIASRSAALNMAIDEALLENVTEPTVRFYHWDHPALSFGYFGRFTEVATHSTERDLVRRWTGGGIVLHGDDLTYSIVIPAVDPAFSESPMSIYEKIHSSIRAALAADGRSVELAINGTPKISDNCFANPVRADVLSDGRKVAGAAQRRTRRGLLQQGSIQGVDLSNEFADRFTGEVCSKCDHKMLDKGLIARAQEIAEQKYGADSWLQRR